MIGRLRELIGTLEQRVAARTEQLRASADVGRAAASILDTTQLLREVVNLITERFGFYYAAVFLIDDTGKWAVLHEATGEVGRTLKERGHRLEVGSQSMVGAAIRHRRPRIALDVGEEAVRFANPLLPETRSEIALPLIVGNRVLGALGVQSKEEAAFDEASAAVLQSMADQIAIALSNTQQFQETQASLQHAHQQYEASLALAQAEDATGVLSAFVTHIAPDAHLGLLVSYGPREADGHRSSVAIEASWGLGASAAQLTPGMRLTLDQLPFLNTIAPTEPLVVNDAQEVGVDLELRRSMETYHARSLVGLPLNAGGVPIGALLILSQEPRTYPAAELRAWQVLAGQAAIVLRNQQLAREAQATLKQLDETNRRLIGQAWRDYARAGGGAVRKIDLKPGLPADESLAPLPSIVEAPVMVHGLEVGSLRLEDTAPDRIWTASELALLQAVAGEVSIALENTRLIEQTERRAWRESIIGEVSGRMFAANDLETIIQIAVEELGQALRVSRAEIQIGSDVIAPALVEASPPGGNGQSAKRQE
jgi:GAF domain-containing protein